MTNSDTALSSSRPFITFVPNDSDPFISNELVSRNESRPVFSRIETPLSSTSKQQLITYHHHHYIVPSDRATDNLEETMQRIVQEATAGKSGTLAPLSRSKRANSQTADAASSSPTKKKKTTTIVMSHGKVTFTIDDVPAPPHVKYAENMSALFNDWEDETSAQVYVRGVSVPVRYWGTLYKGHMSETWTLIKGHYSNWKVCLLTSTLLKNTF